MCDFDPLYFDGVYEHSFSDKIVDIVISRAGPADFLIQTVGADRCDPRGADIAASALFPEKITVRKQSLRHCKIFVLQIHDVDRISENVGGSVDQILQSVSGEYGVDEQMHADRDLLQFRQVFHSQIK